MSEQSPRSPLDSRPSRRGLFKFRALAVGAFSVASLLAACGGAGSSATSTTGAATQTSTGPLTGEVKFLNLTDWIGPHTVEDFQSKNPGATITQIAEDMTSSSGPAAVVIQNPSAYDMVFLDASGLGQLTAAGQVQPYDTAAMPNYSAILPVFQKAFPQGVPLDTGQIGIAYRKDKVSEKIATWKDFWSVVPKYPGKTILIDYDRDVIGNALIMLGYSANSTNTDEINKAKDAVLAIKPAVQAFKVLDIAKSLVDGSAYMTMGYDFETAAAMEKNPNIAWVAPPEGLVAYVEGWVAVKGTQHMDIAQSFTDFQHSPDQYKSFVDTMGVPNVQGLKQPPIMDPVPQAQFLQYLGPEATQAVADAWTQIKS
ncbi:MAG: extracellular solute-binding protein [Actinobacteria bacterium]|nr:extracellular solute-binding protein [Actinomycetota bacterium]